VGCILPNDVAAGSQEVVGHWGRKSVLETQRKKAKATLTSQAGVRDEVGETHCERRGDVGEKIGVKGGKKTKWARGKTFFSPV
jgi:hypothetical protein